MRALILFVIFFISGCISTFGDIHTTRSDFDGSTEISMIPAPVCKDGTFGTCFVKFGLYRSSRMPTDMVVLKIMIGSIESFTTSDPVQFNIDGDIVALNSPDPATMFDLSEGGYESSWSYKTFIVDKSFLKRLIEGTRVALKVTTSKGYYEGVFSSDKMTTARPAFKQFYRQVFELNI